MAARSWPMRSPTQRAVTLRFLAEGATSAFFDMRIALLNPGATAATADLQFLQRGGAPFTTP